MSRSYKDMFNNNNRDNNTSNKFKTPKNSTFDMFSINVSKAEKDTRQVFDYAKSQLTDYEKYSTASMQKVAKVYSNTYKSIYSDLANQHKSYLNDLIDREIQAANRVSKIWNSVDRTSNSNSSSRSSERLFNVNKNNSNNANINLDTSNLDEASNSIKAAANDMGNSNLKNAKSMSAAANLISGAANVLVSGVERFLTLWIDRFFDGMDRIVNTYEDTYQTVSVLMDINQSQYAEVQSKSLDKINELNLGNNIAISNVMKELETVVKLGVTGEDAKNKAISDSITKAINPYIETTSDAYTDLQLKLGDKFVTTMNGMAQSVATTAGSTRFMQRNINDILTSMEPIVLNAKSDYADKVLGPMVQELESYVNKGDITQAEAEKLKQSALDMTLDPYEALTNGSITTRVAANKVADSGGDFTNAYSNLTALLESEIQLQKDTKPGTLESSITTDVFGSNLSYATDKQKILETHNNFNSSSSYEAGLTAQNNFANDKHTTAKQQKEISAENASLGLSQFRQQYPDAYEILSTMAATLTNIFNEIAFSKIADIGTNIFSKLLTKGTGSTLENTVSKGISKGITKNIGGKALNGLARLGGGSTGAGIATVGGVAAGALISAGGIYHMSDANKTLNNKLESSENKKLADVQMAGGTTAAVGGAIGAGALLALGASNPIGWVALGIGALGLAAAQTAKNLKKTNGALEATNESFDNVAGTAKNLASTQINTVKENTRDLVKDAKDTISADTREAYEDFLVGAGAITQEDADNDKYLITELQKMTEDIRDTGDTTVNSLSTVYGNAEHNIDTLNEYLKENSDVAKANAKAGTENNDAIAKKFADLIKSGNETEAKALADTMGLSKDKYNAAKWWAEGGHTEFKEFRDALANVKGIDEQNKVLTRLKSNFGIDTKQLASINENNQAEYANALAQYVELKGKKDYIDSTYNETGMTFSDEEQSLLDQAKEDLSQYLTKEELTGEYHGYSTLKNGQVSLDGLIQNYISSHKAWATNFTDFQKSDGSNSIYDDYGSRDTKLTNNAGYATGIPYVSEDETTRIHKGETVLNKEDARKYREAKASIQKIAKSYEDFDKLDTSIAIPETSNSSGDSDASRSDILVAINDGINRLVEIISKSHQPNRDSQNSIINKQKLLAKNLSSSIFDDDLINLKTTTTTRAR